MQFVVQPLFELWWRFNPSHMSKVMLDNLRCNKSQWDKLMKAEEEEAAQKTATSESSTDTVVTRTVECTVENTPLDLSDSEDEKENTEPAEINIEARCDVMSEETDFPSCLPRRHSSPPPVSPKELKVLLSARRGSLPMAKNSLNGGHLNRRHSLPTSNIYHTGSFDRLIDKLASLAECSPTNGSRIFEYDYDQPKVTSLSANLKSTVLSQAAQDAAHVQTAAHGLEQQLHAQKHLATDSQVSAIAQRTVSSNRRHSQGIRSQNREPLTASTRDNERRRCSVPVTFQIGSARSAMASVATTSKCAQRTALVVQKNLLVLPQSTVDHRRMSSPAQIECLSSLQETTNKAKTSLERRGSGSYHSNRGNPTRLSSDVETQPLLSVDDDATQCSGESCEPVVLLNCLLYLPSDLRYRSSLSFCQLTENFPPIYLQVMNTASSPPQTVYLHHRHCWPRKLLVKPLTARSWRRKRPSCRTNQWDYYRRN